MVANHIVALKWLLLISLCCDNISGDRQCGKIMTRTRKLTGKIVGGYDVGYYKYPWFGAMQIDDETFCGGALIGPNYLLTAAHCYDNPGNQKLEDYFKVKMGLYNNCKKEPTQKTFNVAKVHIHEKYAKNKPYYDIALLELKGDTQGYQAICLPPKPLTDQEQEAEGWIIGLGNLVESINTYPCELREGRILIYDGKTCLSMLKNITDSPKEIAFTNALCAGYKAGGVDSCQGDSGGPLMTVNSVTKLWQTVGITSFGYSCGAKDQMGLYTDVSKYLDWIEDKSGIRAADEYAEENNNVSNVTEGPNDHNNNSPVGAYYLAENFNAIYDHVMNNPHAPKEIVIRFKNKQKQKQEAAKKAKRKTKHKHFTKTTSPPS